jgi:hypothetical protein
LRSGQKLQLPAAPTIFVNTTDQHGGECSLSSAVVAANLNAAFGGCPAGHGDDVIFVPAGSYEMTTAEHTDPNGFGEAALQGVSTGLGNQLEIRGAGSAQTMLARKPGVPAMRFFMVYGDLTLRGLSVEGGEAPRDGGVALLLPGPLDGFGGSLRAISSRFAHNSARSGGVVAPAVIAIVEGIAVQEALTPRPSAMLTIVETVAVDDGVVAGNTLPGSDVIVRPIDPATGGTPVTVTFSSITRPGMTAVTTSSVGPATPAGFAMGTPRVYFDITTTATYTPPITVCIDYSGMRFRSPSALQLFHFGGGVWVNHTLSLDLATTTACAVVDSLSPFAIFEPANQPPVANAGSDQVLEATSPSGAVATLNGSASSDPDADLLAYTWTGPFGTRSGAVANVTLPLGPHVITLSVDNGNGGTSAGTLVVTVQDTIAPGVTITTPIVTNYQFNEVVVASYSCSDGGSGIATCAGPVPLGSPIDTSAEGQHPFVVVATDAAGNTTTTAVAYSVTGREGRMTGYGEIEARDGREHRFGFHVAERHAGVERGGLLYTRTTLKSGKQKEKTDRFQSASVGAIAFWDDPAFRPGAWPKPTVDSVVFSGTGRWNGVSGYTFEARASDEGEPGRGRATFALTIRDRKGTVVATAGGTLRQGNIQSERLIRR